MARSRSDTFGSSRQRSQTNGSSNALSFLERSSNPSLSSTLPAAVTNPWPVGFVPPPSESKADRAFTWSSQVSTTSLPRTSALAFIETPTARGSVSSVGTDAGEEIGLSWLGGEVVRENYSRGGVFPRSNSSLGRSGSWDSDDEMDSNICPSMLFTCFPCLSCFRPSKRQRQSGPSFLGGGSIDDVGSSVKRDSRTQKGLARPLLTEQPPPPTNFPKDVKLIEVEVESVKNLRLAERVNVTDVAGTYAMLRVTPAQEGVGEQAVQTSLATRMVNPNWGGRERFTFFVTDTENSRAFLGMQLLYRPLRPLSGRPLPPPTLRREASGASSAPAGSRPGDVVIGEGIIDLLGLFPVVNATYTPGALKGNSRRVAVSIRERDGKRRTMCSLILGLRCRRVNETIDTREDRIYEYERWTQLAGWSTTGKSREGKWSTLDGSVISDAFNDVAPPARDDAEVVLPWCPFGGWEYSTAEEEGSRPGRGSSSTSRLGERDGETSSSGVESWVNLAVVQKGRVWMEGYVQGNHAVRRRLWRRVYLEPRSSTSDAAALPSPV